MARYPITPGFFDGSMDPSLNDMTFSDIPGTLYSALQMANLAPTLEGLLARAAVITPTEAISDVSRSILYTGLPLEGYDLTTDTMEDQLMKIRSFEGTLESWDFTNRITISLHNVLSMTRRYQIMI
ncbi:uncharacterized protein LOC106011678 [Aplysia californica]|uniref:Uncharacterized protein LOC106011678 n=1 Tax=Aplysia californica TaxID=6500 RepID=A0ABM0ZZ92_APLCA|nr:uncharacterized protein LOC106011678 [Aplysia californica]